MELLNSLFHIDVYLVDAITVLGPWTYVLLFGIIFAETGLVIMPFLPGDSLLFAVGTLAGGGLLDIRIVYVIMLVAAIIGDTVNYWIGNILGPKVFAKEDSKFFKKAYLEKTRQFYEKHGGKTIIIARFLPIIRTFAPFVAGIGSMHYGKFLLYNVVGAFLWVTSLTFTGFFLGGLPFIKENFEYAVFGIILISLLPLFWEYIRYKRGPEHAEDLKKTTYTDVQETFHDEHKHSDD